VKSPSWRKRTILPGKRKTIFFRKINPDLSGLFLTENTLCHGESPCGFYFEDTTMITVSNVALSYDPGDVLK